MESFITANDLILQRILHFTPFQDLLICGLVNKRWNHISRSVLLKERRCLAKIGSDKPCQHLLSLNELLLKSEERLPFNGLSMSYSYHYVDQCLQDVALLRTKYSTLLEFLPIKHLNVILDQYTDCLAMNFIKILVKERGAEIQELSISTTDYEFSSLLDFFSIDKSIQYWLPNLISLELKTEQDQQVLQEIAAAAPNLQKICGNIRPDHLPNILAVKKTKLIKEFHLNITNDNLATCFQFSKLQPKLERLWINSKHYQGSNVSFVPELCSSLLNSSYSSLNYLDIEHLDLILLVSKTEFCLENLTSLNVYFNLGLDRYLGGFSFSRINFQALFPHLKLCKVSTSENAYSLRDMRNIPDSFKYSDSFYSSLSVVDFRTKGTPFRPVSLSARIPLASVFPNVKHVGIKSCSDITSYLEYVLSAWPDLESLQFSTREYPTNLTNLDALFCGISEEEWIYLHSFEIYDSGYLKNYQIVPIKRSLLFNKNLKTLKIKVGHNDTCNLKKVSTQAFMSAVCGQLVFSRMSGLRVEIMRKVCVDALKGNCCFAFDDLQQFAKISTDVYELYP